MKIIEYNEKYKSDVINLFNELQTYLKELDKEKFNIITENYGSIYLNKTLDEIKKYNGKIYLAIDNDTAIGLISGVINNDGIDTYDFNCPKRGRITELVISKNYKNKNIGSELLLKIEDYLYSVDCKNILIGVFAYNKNAIKFYKSKNYHTRMIKMIK